MAYAIFKTLLTLAWNVLRPVLDEARRTTCYNRPFRYVIKNRCAGKRDGSFPECHPRPNKDVCCYPGAGSNTNWTGDKGKVKSTVNEVYELVKARAAGFGAAS